MVLTSKKERSRCFLAKFEAILSKDTSKKMAFKEIGYSKKCSSNHDSENIKHLIFTRNIK
jgi:hypothetical protein